MEHTTELLGKEASSFWGGIYFPLETWIHWGNTRVYSLRCSRLGLFNVSGRIRFLKRCCMNPPLQMLPFEREEPRNLHKQIQVISMMHPWRICQGLWYRSTFWSLKITPKGLEKHGNELICWRYIQGNIPWFQPGFAVGFLLLAQVKCIAGFEPFPTDEVVA